jgi:hypothetical protein
MVLEPAGITPVVTKTFTIELIYAAADFTAQVSPSFLQFTLVQF